MTDGMELKGHYFAYDSSESAEDVAVLCPHCGGSDLVFQGAISASRSVLVIATCRRCRKSLRVRLKLI